jgi:hypothetical protein
LERQGRIRKLYEDGTALVICTEACRMECNQCGGCLRNMEGLIAQNPDSAQLGELVLVRTNKHKMLLAALMLFVLPIVCFFAGYRIGMALFGAGKVAGGLAFAFGIGISLVYDRHIGSKPGSGYRVIKYPQNINKGDN